MDTCPPPAILPYDILVVFTASQTQYHPHLLLMAMARPGSLSAPTFDLESWSSNYSGPLLPLRLRHVALNCPSLAQQALTIALATAKAGKDVSIYRSIIDLSVSLNQPVDIDQEWIDRQDDANKRELGRLEGELRGYKNNLIRESIRMGQEDLATHILLTGGPLPSQKEEESTKQTSQAASGYAAAYSAFAKMRDFCTTPTHIAGMTLRLLFTSIIQAVSAYQSGHSPQGHFSSLSAQASRLSSTGVKAEEEIRLKPVWSAARGIAQLGQSQYRDAAFSFLQANFTLASNGSIHGFDFCRTCASANDIAIYGGLTALATMTREELTTNVLGGDFRSFLELEPHLRKAITLFTTGKFRAALDILWRYYSDWNLDIILGIGFGTPQGSHVDRLFARIREKSIISYFASFSQVSLNSLAETFPARASDVAPVQLLETELIQMIENGSLNARLDVVNGLLLSPQEDHRTTTQQDALAAAEEVERTLLQRLHKINVTLARVEIPNPNPRGSASWPHQILS